MRANAVTKRIDTGIRELVDDTNIRIRRTEKEILRAVRSRPLSEASYLMGRIRRLEAKIVELMNEGSKEAAEMVLREAPYLGRYYHHH